MADDEKQAPKSDGEADKKKPINDPLVRTDVEAPRQPFEASESEEA